MNMKKILIIGGNGYIGTHLSKFLKKDYNIQIFGKKENDYNNLSKEFISQFEIIILLAGHSSVLMCNGDLNSSWNNNVRNFSNLVEKTNYNQKIIYASSSSVYGNLGNKVFKEEDFCLNFVNNYDLTKISLDLVAEKFINKGRSIIGLRFGTVNGGSNLIRKDLMINSMVYSAMYNGNITISNKNISRPILSIKDLSRAVKSIIDSELFFSGIYNLSSFNSTVEQISNFVKSKINVDIIDNGNFNGTYNFNIDSSKFEKLYNFKFLETPISIIDDVIHCYNNCNPEIVSRSQYFYYRG